MTILILLCSNFEKIEDFKCQTIETIFLKNILEGYLITSVILRRDVGKATLTKLKTKFFCVEICHSVILSGCMQYVMFIHIHMGFFVKWFLNYHWVIYRNRAILKEKSFHFVLAGLFFFFPTVSDWHGVSQGISGPYSPEKLINKSFISWVRFRGVLQKSCHWYWWKLQLDLLAMPV